jgi:malonyl-CoA/methylmalonyl-CoA synthetase
MPNADFNLYTHFARQFAAHANDELLCTEKDRSYDYAEIDRCSARIACFLTDLGLSPGDRVSVQVAKSAESLCLYLACLRGGFVYHPMNMGYKSRELEYFLTDAEPAIVVCDARNEDAVREIVNRIGIQHLLTLNKDGNGSIRERSDNHPETFATVRRENSDLAALLYSSGTTGVPKGIMLSHGNLLSNTESLVEAWGFSSADRLLHALPIFHVHGLFVAIGCVLLSGASMRWLPAYNVKQVIRYLPECTVMMGVPTYYTRLLDDKSFNAKISENVRLFVSGSAPLLTETFADFEARTGQRILERYGMTETNMNTSNPLLGERKAGTVGPPLPGVTVRITDDKGRELEAGEVGNLQVKGPNVFTGYWKMPDKTEQDFTDDGFFETGDKGCIDQDGYVSIVGRAKDVVITGGLNVYPKEVELFIDELPGVKESAVIGIAHPDLGEVAVAVVVRETGCDTKDAEIIRACRKSLAAFKVPRQVVFVDELPRNTMSKVQKNILRETFDDLSAS